jgi:hypothetical protein
MPSYPSFLLPDDSVKIRFREPFASQALNMKTDGIVPPGIYNGFTPNVDMATPNVLLLNTDPYRNDSVAVGDVYNLNGAIWTADYNLTIRTTLQVQLDFTGHTVFPCWVVLRPAYSIVAHPFSGLTNAQLVTINDLTVDDTDTYALHHGDIKICRVNSVGPVVPVTTPNGPVDYIAPTTTSRNDNGGALVTQSQLTGSLIPVFARATRTTSYSKGVSAYSLISPLTISIIGTAGRPVLIGFSGAGAQQLGGCDTFGAFDIDVNGTMLSVLLGCAPGGGLTATGRLQGEICSVSFSYIYVPPVSGLLTLQAMECVSGNPFGSIELMAGAGIWALAI